MTNLFQVKLELNSNVVLSLYFLFLATLSLYMVRSFCPFLTLQLRCESQQQIEERDIILRVVLAGRTRAHLYFVDGSRDITLE